MAFLAAVYLSVTYESYPNYWLKCFVQGTTTPINMATDSTGGTLLAKAEVSAGGTVPIGYFKTAGDVIIQPYLDVAYDAWLFPTEAEADANDTSNAVQIANNVDLSTVLDGVVFDFDTTALMLAAPLEVGVSTRTKEFRTGDGGGGDYFIETGGSSNGFDRLLMVNGNVAVLQYAGGNIDIRQFGPIANGTTDDSLVLDAAAVFALANGLREIFVYEGTISAPTLALDTRRVMFLGQGEIIDAYRVNVKRPYEGKQFSMLSDIDPNVHLQNIANKRAPVVVMVGDSLATPFAVSSDQENDGLYGHIKDLFRKSYPQKNFTFHNRAIGGAKWFDVSRYPNAVPTTSDWVTHVDFVASTTSGSAIVTAPGGVDLTDVEAGWYVTNVDGAFNSLARVLSVSGQDITVNQDASDTLADEDFEIFKPWLEQVIELQPDLVIVSAGMNDGTAGWVRFNAPSSAFFGVMDKLRGANKVPDTLLITNNMPSSVSATFGLKENQEGRAGIAGLVRAIAGFYPEVGLLDVNRWNQVLRDGLDPVSNYFTYSVGPSVVDMPNQQEDVLDYIDEWVFDSIPANFWLPSSSSFLQFKLSARDSNIGLIKDDAGFLSFEWNEGVANAFHKSRSTIVTPITGAAVTILRRSYANHLEVLINGEYIYDGAIIKGGATYDATLDYTDSDLTVEGTNTFYQAYAQDYVPASFDDQVYNDPAIAGEGGNTGNHPNASASDIIYRFPIESQNWVADTPVILTVGMAALNKLIADEGVYIDFANNEYAIRTAAGVVTTGLPEDIITVGNSEAYPGVAVDSDGNNLGIDIVDNAGSIVIPTSGIPWDTTEGTIIIEYIMGDNLSTGAPLHVGDAANDYLTIVTDIASLTRTVILAGGVSQVNHNIVGTANVQFNKVAVSFSENNVITCINGRGVLMTSDITLGTMADIRLGSDNTEFNETNVIVRSLLVIPQKMDTLFVQRQAT